jgi:lipopolysaccharide heptosyltransferase I
MSSPVDPQLAPPERIVVFRLGAIGDVVRTLPAVRLIRKTWPQAELAWAVEEPASSLLLSHPDLDRVLVLARREIVRRGWTHPIASWSVLSDFVKRLRAVRADLAIDFQGSLKSALLMRLSGAARRVGFDRADTREQAHWFANQRVRLPASSRHRVERAVFLARAAGAADGPRVADLALSGAERAQAASRALAIADNRPLIALAPWSSRRQSWKRYPTERWVEVARRLVACGASIVVLSGPGEERQTEQFCREAGSGVVSSGPLPLRELAALIGACRLYVGGDTGPMHLAWAAGVPVVAVYGPTDPALNAPYGPGHIVLASDSCTARDAADRFPGITPDRIVAAAQSRLSELPLENRC